MMTKTLIAAAMATLLAACTTTSPDVVQRGDAQRLANVQDATVLSVRPVTVEGNQSGLGGATGAVIGGVAGSTRSSGKEQAVIGVIGSVAGHTALAMLRLDRAVEAIDKEQPLVADGVALVVDAAALSDYRASLAEKFVTAP